MVFNQSIKNQTRNNTWGCGIPDWIHSARMWSDDASDNATESSLREVAWLKLAGVSSVQNSIGVSSI